MTSDDLEEMLEAYVECALWSSSANASWDEDTQSFVEDEKNDASFLDHNFAADDVATESVEAMRADCAAFIEANAEDLDQMAPEQVGHDFWLTRNGHGAGFWDRGLREVGQRLTDACRPYGDSNLYLGDDQKIYTE